MKNIKPRHELKIFINIGDYYSIKNRLKVISKIDNNSGLGGKYVIRSLYFDSLNNKALMDKINGVNQREKFRIRFYNFDNSFIRLEKKSKLNGLCYKRGVTISKNQCESIINNDIEWMLCSGNRLLQEFYGKIKGNLLKPKTIVDYIREA